jgi:hypothetical protein
LELGYIPLPQEVVIRVQEAVNEIRVAAEADRSTSARN